MIQRAKDVPLHFQFRGVVRCYEDDVLWLLAMNSNNRAVSGSNVKAIYALIVGHEWRTDVSPIRIGSNRVLLNGQHRLMAIAQAIRDGVVPFVDILIETNVDPEVRKYDDTHNPRRLHERFDFDGIETKEQGRFCAAVVNALAREASSTPKRVSAKEAEEIFNKHKQGILAVSREFSAGKQSGYYNSSCACAITEYITRHPEQGMEFLAEFSNPTTSDPAAVMLQKRMLQTRGSGGGGAQANYRYQLAVCACRNHRDRQPAKILKPIKWETKRSVAFAEV